jgi:hypothetical protein
LILLGIDLNYGCLAGQPLCYVLWTLKSSNGFVLYSDENNQEIIPLWPHPEYAKAVKRDDWNNCTHIKLTFIRFQKNGYLG